MAEERAEANQQQDPATEDMDLVEDSAVNGAKRAREEEGNHDESKKQKFDKSVEEERLQKLEGEGEGNEKLEGKGEGEGEGEENEEENKGEEKSGPVSVGPKSFGSSVELFDYFYTFLHYWPPNLNINKYEHMVLLELLKKGHSEPEKKIGVGVQAFQVRYHPMWKSRCFFLIREDDTVDDFSFRKCVDNILPLPEDMKIKSDGNVKGQGGKGGGGRGGRGRGRGRGGKRRY